MVLNSKLSEIIREAKFSVSGSSVSSKSLLHEKRESSADRYESDELGPLSIRKEGEQVFRHCFVPVKKDKFTINLRPASILSLS